MNLFKTTLLATALLAVAPLASAAVTSDSMTVSIQINNSCTVTADDLDFGPQTSLASDIDVDTTVSVSCTGIGSINIGFSVGTGTGASYASRKMTGASSLISYSLYDDAARLPANILGDGSAGSVRIGATSTGAAQSFPVFGRVFGSQGAKPTGSYTDSVVATVEF